MIAVTIQEVDMDLREIEKFIIHEKVKFASFARDTNRYYLRGRFKDLMFELDDTDHMEITDALRGFGVRVDECESIYWPETD